MLKRWVIGLGVLALVVVAVVVGVRAFDRVGPLLSSEGCEARVGGHSVSLTLEQSENVALMAAISMQRGMPARAATIAIATSAQESKLYNIEHGDRDSLGLFQQRPSQGWGTVQEILNPYYSINAFYDALARVDGYESMKITEAAQLVQRSAFPEAYAEHEADARALASALTGNSPRAFTCVVDDDGGEAPDRLVETGLTRRADVVRREVGAAFGELSLGGFAPGGVRDGHQPGSTHYDGRAIDIFVRPVSPENRQRGWAIAQYLVAQADRLVIQNVIFDDRIWTSGSRSDEGWRDYDPPERSGTAAILEHRDHVHVDVKIDSGLAQVRLQSVHDRRGRHTSRTRTQRRGVSHVRVPRSTPSAQPWIGPRTTTCRSTCSSRASGLPPGVATDGHGVCCEEREHDPAEQRRRRAGHGPAPRPIPVEHAIAWRTAPTADPRGARRSAKPVSPVRWGPSTQLTDTIGNRRHRVDVLPVVGRHSFVAVDQERGAAQLGVHRSVHLHQRVRRIGSGRAELGRGPYLVAAIGKQNMLPTRAVLGAPVRDHLRDIGFVSRLVADPAPAVGAELLGSAPLRAMR